MPNSAPLDRSWLSAWIQPQHLTEDGIAGHRRGFSDHPVRLHVLHSFLVEERAWQLSAFLRREARFQTVFGLYSKPDGVREPAWTAADDRDRFYRMGVIAGVEDDCRLSDHVLTYLRFLQTLRDDRALALIGALTGRPVGAPWTTAHAMVSGDYLLVHNDQVKDRQIAFVLFLAPTWPDEAGGALRLQADAQTWQVTPAYNSLALFDVTAKTSHEVGLITPAAGDLARLTISGWFTQHAPAP